MQLLGLIYLILLAGKFCLGIYIGIRAARKGEDPAEALRRIVSSKVDKQIGYVSWFLALALAIGAVVIN